MLCFIQDGCNFFRCFRMLVGITITPAVAEIKRKDYRGRTPRHAKYPTLLKVQGEGTVWIEIVKYILTHNTECLCTHYTVFIAWLGF